MVTAIKFRQPETWEPEADLKYYELDPLDLIQKEKEKVGWELKNRRRKLYPTDRWIYNPRFPEEKN